VIRSSIARSTADSITVRDLDLCEDLMGRIDFGSMTYLVVSGRLPNVAQSRLFNAILVGLCEHGLTPGAIAARLTYAGAPEALQASVASGLLGAGTVYLGVLEGAARMLQEAGPSTSDDEARLRELAGTILDRAGTRVPGLGHPIHRTEDPRTRRLYALATELDLLGPHARLLQAVHAEFVARTGKPLPLNAAGASGALLSDLGFDWGTVRGFALVARTAGLVAHLTEERQEPLGDHLWRWVDQLASES
jgi:citrate synthase